VNNWPNFFIVGAPKAGTTSLHAQLQSVPGIFMSRIKEPNYFSRMLVPDDHQVRPIRDSQKYLQLFDGVTSESIIGEASPTYLADPDAPRLIHDVSPEARILISLRDPVERAFSHYLMMRNNGTARLPFLGEILRGLELAGKRQLVLLRPEIGLYHDQVARFVATFGSNRVLVILFEELGADTGAVLRGVLEFLGVNGSVTLTSNEEHRKFGEARGPLVRLLYANRTIARLSEILVSPRLRKFVREKFLLRNVPKPVMDQDARDFLVAYYREDVTKLSAQLGRPLPWRNFA
jgi:Sulfotransferase family